MDLTHPEIDFVELAGSMGIAARTVENAEELEQAVGEALGSGKPQLVHVPISGHKTGGGLGP